MKTNIFKLTAILIAVIALSTAGCKKDDDNDDNSNTNSLQQLSKDGVAVGNATGDVMKDANSILSGGSGKTLYDLPCNVTIDSTNIVNDTITYSITYDGLNCDGTLLREGNAEVKKNVNTHWSDAGAKVSIEYIALKITRVSDNKFVIINGSVTYENVTGGYLTQLGTIYTTITHKASGVIYAAFDDNSTSTWHIARQITYSGAAGSYVITGDGFGSADGYSNLECWGVNRDGENFYSQITQSIVLKEACGWDPCSGIIIHDIPSELKKATVSFGYDDNNQLITNGDCPTRFRFDWDVNGNSGTLYLQLH
ncbi:MAG: hypothetical protein V1904_10405 [Bacteroidota bacterium]